MPFALHTFPSYFPFYCLALCLPLCACYYLCPDLPTPFCPIPYCSPPLCLSSCLYLYYHHLPATYHLLPACLFLLPLYSTCPPPASLGFLVLYIFVRFYHPSLPPTTYHHHTHPGGRDRGQGTGLDTTCLACFRAALQLLCTARTHTHIEQDAQRTAVGIIIVSKTSTWMDTTNVPLRESSKATLFHLWLLLRQHRRCLTIRSCCTPRQQPGTVNQAVAKWNLVSSQPNIAAAARARLSEEHLASHASLYARLKTHR